MNYNRAVIGAVLQLGNCSDFLDSKFTGLIETYFPSMEEEYSSANKQLLKNLDGTNDINKNMLVS
jgi:hypothetical protein